MITWPQYQRACYLVDAHGAADVFASWLYPNRQGRRSPLTPRSFLIGCLVSIESKGSMRYKDVHRVLTADLPPRAMVELGVAEHVRTGDGRDIARVCLTRDAFYGFTRTLRRRCGGGRNGRPIQTEDKDALLDVVNRILRATHPTRPDGAGSYSVDESGVWAWSRGYKQPKELKEQLRSGDREPILEQPRASVDPDAKWSAKTSKAGKDEAYFGYALHGVVRAPALGTSYADEPLILQRIDLTPANTDIVDATLAMLDAIRADGVPVHEVIGDRHYSYKAASRWAEQLHARGIRQVFDLRENELHFTDGGHGTRVVAGIPHCPATPEHLNGLARPGPSPKRPPTLLDQDTAEQQQQHWERADRFHDAIKERQAYALQRIGRSTANPRDSRWRCPALAGKVGCHLRPGTVQAAAEVGLPLVETPPDPHTAPALCTNRGGTVTLRHQDLDTKHQQEHYWGSEQWELSYARRTYVEGIFGSLKNAAVANLSRDAFRGDCLGLRLLHVGLCCVVTNVRAVRKWSRTTGRRLDLDDRLLADDKPPTEFALDVDDAA